MRKCTKCGSEKDDSKDGGEFYFDSRTGKPRSWCKSCTNAHNIAQAAANPEKHNARSKAWRDANRDRWLTTVKTWQKNNPDKVLQNRRKTIYNIDFNAMWEAQQGLCALCGRPMERTGRTPDAVCVDHDRSCCPDHKSCGKCVRGLIHWGCNMVLGYAKDDPQVLSCAVEYITRWQARQLPAILCL